MEVEGASGLEGLRRRLERLDELDACNGEKDGQAIEDLRARLEAENAAVYSRIRKEIRREPRSLLKWIEGEGGAKPGLSYDWRDEVVAGVLALREPEGAKAAGGEMVFYQPTPVRHVLELIARGGITVGDVVVDLGSGMGHVSLLVGMLTDAQCVGIELEGAYVAAARAGTERLALSERVTFVEGDARRAELGRGTVFYLYTPFTGGMLAGDAGAIARGERAAAVQGMHAGAVHGGGGAGAVACDERSGGCGSGDGV